MPVIINIPSDPTDLVIQGEKMRSNSIGDGFAIVQGEIKFSPMVGNYPVPPREVLRNPFAKTMIAANSCIATPCGALYPHEIGQRIMDLFVESTQLWALTGVTRDSAGAVLGNCRVVVFDTGRLAMGEAPIVAEGSSDGSGNYSIPVPGNRAYQAIAYKPGGPDVAGITRSDVVAISNG